MQTVTMSRRRWLLRLFTPFVLLAAAAPAEESLLLQTHVPRPDVHPVGPVSHSAADRVGSLELGDTGVLTRVEAFDALFPQADMEDFEEGTAGSCTGPLDASSSNGVFSPGDILEGLWIDDVLGNGTFELEDPGQGSSWGASKVLRRNSDNAIVEIRFTGSNVYEAGMDVYSETSSEPTVSAYALDGGLLVSRDITASKTASGFFGIYATQVVNRIEIDPHGSFATFDNIRFGTLEKPPPVAGFGRALAFDGLDDYVRVPGTNHLWLGGSSSYSVALWAQPATNGHLYRLDGQTGMYRDFIRIEPDGTVTFGVAKGGSAPDTITSSNAVPWNRWSHIACVKDGSNTAVFVDGVCRAKGTVRAVTYGAGISAADTYIGVKGNNMTDYFAGRIDEVTLWNMALDAHEIAAWMYRRPDASHPHASELLLELRFDDDLTPSIAWDSSGHECDGILSNMTELAWVDSGIRDWHLLSNAILNGRLCGNDVNGTSTDGTNWTLTFELLSTGSLGSAVTGANNAFVYTPHPDVEGTDSFTYQVVNGSGGTSQAASVSVTIDRYEPPVLYVSLSGAHQSPYETWLKAATNIQAAVDRAAPGAVVTVSNGVYALTAHINVTNAITVRSEHPLGAVLDGGHAVRGIRVAHADAVVDGFVVTNCAASFGAGVRVVDGGTIQNCLLVGNESDGKGGGVWIRNGGTVRRCVIRNNCASEEAGGVFVLNDGPVIENCVVAGNTAAMGGGIWLNGGGSVRNATVAANTGVSYVGGIVCEGGGTILNTISYSNTNDNFGLFGGGGLPTMSHCCLTPEWGDDPVTNPPAFLDGPAAAYRLSYGSPCVDAASAAYAPSNDLCGVRRPLDGDFDETEAPDIGAYEYDPAATDSDGDGMDDGFEHRHGLNATNDADAAENADNDDFNNFEEWVAQTDPTNAQSYFRIEDITNAPPVTIYFLSASNRVYTLLTRTDLLAGDWTNDPAQTAVPGAGGMDAFTDPTADPRRFYRLRVEAP